ncbi:MAG: GGDEF domain-containing protein [Bacilli bacterium]|nr:GGDEF domain-containing protein [Bacilli bacterium]
MSYIVNNFALLCIAIAMFFIILYNIHGEKKQNIYSFFIIGIALLLSIFRAVVDWSCQFVDNPFIPVLFEALGYTIRPIVVLLFIMLVGKKVKYQWIFYIPIVIVAIIYSFSLFIDYEPLGRMVFYYLPNEEGTLLVFHRGYLYLNFVSHIVCGIYMIYFLVNAFRMLNGKHKTDCIVLVVCALFVMGATALESLQYTTSALNVTIALSCLFYYLYLYVQHSRRDALTGLYDRKTYYFDINKYGKSINGVISLDMNGLKYINDHKGHQAGDDAILCISKIIENCSGKNGYVYRLGGDEFTVLFYGAKKKSEIEDVVKKIKEEVDRTEYAVSIGFAYSEEKLLTLDEMVKIADEEMYQDKENFYKSGKLERRKPFQNN